MWSWALANGFQEHDECTEGETRECNPAVDKTKNQKKDVC